MGLVKNYYHDEIIAAQDDQRADEFDCYGARLHSLLSELDWFIDNHPNDPGIMQAIVTQVYIKGMMK